MKDRSDKRYCTLDHANKLGELARQEPYLYRLERDFRYEVAEPPLERPRPSRNTEVFSKGPEQERKST